MTIVLALAAFGGGVWLLVESVEGLVETLARLAGAAGISGLVLSALVLGLDLESTAAGVAATLDDLPGAALGTSVGGAIFLVTLGIGLAALAAPFSLRTPPSLLLAALLATALAIGLLLDGLLSRLDGAFLLAGFLPFVLILLRRAREERILAEAPAPRGRLLGRLALGVGGLVVGAELLVFGTERIVGSLGVSETAFGLLAVGAAVSFEEVILELLPAYRGRPEISVGNAIGTLVFLLTASLGAISLARPVPVPDAVRTYHAPALALAVILLCSLLARGRLGRAEGMLLCAAYAVYVVGAVTIA